MFLLMSSSSFHASSHLMQFLGIHNVQNSQSVLGGPCGETWTWGCWSEEDLANFDFGQISALLLVKVLIS